MGFMLPFLSSARIHLNSRCLSQAAFDSGSVDFDAGVIRPSLWRGSVLCCRSWRRLVPVRGQRSHSSSPAAGWMRCEGGGLSRAAGSPLPGLRQRARLLRTAGGGCSPRLGTRAGMLTAAPRRWEGGVDARSVQISLISGVRNFSPTALQFKSLLLFCTGKAKPGKYQTSAKKN